MNNTLVLMPRGGAPSARERPSADREAIRRMPMDNVKIDRSLIKNLPKDGGTLASAGAVAQERA